MDGKAIRRHRVAIVGCGFGGLFAAKRLRRAPRSMSRSSTGRTITCSSRCSISSRRGFSPRATSRRRSATSSATNGTRRVVLGEVVGVDLDARRLTVETVGRAAEIRVRQPDRRHRREPVVLRAPGVRARCARDEDDRPRARAARPDLRRVRDGGTRARPRCATPLADVRRRRRGPDGRRGRGSARRAVAPLAAPQFPQHRSGAGAGRPARRRADDPAVVSRTAASSARPETCETWASRSMSARWSPASTSAGSRRTRRIPAAADRSGDEDLGCRGRRPRRSGVSSPKRPAPSVDRAGRVKVEPDCTLPGHPEVFVIGDLMSLDSCREWRRSRSSLAGHAARDHHATDRGRHDAPAVPLPRPRDDGDDLALPRDRRARPSARLRLPRLAAVAPRPLSPR